MDSPIWGMTTSVGMSLLFAGSRLLSAETGKLDYTAVVSLLARPRESP